MSTANLVLPVFDVSLTDWLAGALGYLPRALAAPPSCNSPTMDNVLYQPWLE